MTTTEYDPSIDGSDDHIPGASGNREETCSERDNRWWTCTRVDGHEGRHEAGLGNGTIIASWPNK